MIFQEDVYKFTYEALREAEQAFNDGEVPVGCVITHKNKIIARSHNQMKLLKDPTAHAEMIAITSACNSQQSEKLNDCDMYITCEPCLMCAGAISNARINNLYFATFEPKFGAAGSVYNIFEENKLNHKVNVYSGALADESSKLLKEFFIKTRHK